MKKLILLSLLTILTLPPLGLSQKVVCFGDSVTLAYTQFGTDYGFCERIGGINKGISGQTTFDASFRFKSDVLALHPKVVTIMFGINDSFIPPTGGDVRVSLTDYKRFLLYFVKTLQRRHIEVVLLTSNPLDDTTRNIRLKPYVEAVRSLSVSRKTKLVDVYQMFSEKTVEGYPFSKLLFDGTHPNEFAHSLIADELRRYIK